jgi:hypothetical protein
MMPKELEYPAYSVGPIAGVSWGAILAGVVVTVATMGSLGLLGAGIGLASAPAADSASGLMKGLGIGGGVWLLVSGIASYLAGGWVTGRMTRTGLVSESVVHSATTWAVTTTAFMFIIGSSIGGLVGGTAHLLGSTSSAAVNGANIAANQDPAAAQKATSQVKDQAGALIQRAQANAPTKEEVAQKAGNAAQAAGATGIGAFVLMLLEFIACTVGGRMGTRVLRPRLIREKTRETVAS